MSTRSHLERISGMCAHHQRLFAYTVADHLDNPDLFGTIADAFTRYEARCHNGEGCS